MVDIVSIGRMFQRGRYGLKQGKEEGRLRLALSSHLKVAPNTVSRWETGTYKPTPEDLDKLSRFFAVPITTFFPDLGADAGRVSALTSATGGLGDKDFEEVIKYAEFRKARLAMEGAKKAKSKR